MQKSGYVKRRAKKVGQKLPSELIVSIYFYNLSFDCRLSSRSTHYGLVGVTTEGHIGALVELNCETDFVANSAEFKALVSIIESKPS